MKPILLILERDNSKKDTVLMQKIKKSYEDKFEKIITYEKHVEYTSTFLDRQKTFSRFPPFFRKILKALTLLRYPSRWNYFFTRSQQPSIASRCNEFKKYVRKLKETHPRIVLLGRSSGARIATLIADELNIEKVMCMGYPFKHPDHPDEPERYAHLATIKTPTEIIQGTQDVYGGVEIKQKYKFSPAVTLTFLETDHNFEILQT